MENDAKATNTDNIMAKKKNVGFNYLHRHPQTETSLNVDAEHVIIDRKEWEEVVDYFHQYPEEVKKLGKQDTRLHLT